MINQDLTVHPISLKQIVENLDKIAEKTGKFGEETNNLSAKEKKKLRELMGKFNEFGKSLRGDQALIETAKNLSEMAQLAKKYAMNENNTDFMQKETVQRDYKQVDNITKQFQKLAKECVSHLMQLNALYEDAGNIFERYYDTSVPMVNETPMPTIEPEIDPNIDEPITEPSQPDVEPLPTPRHPLEPNPGQKPRPKGKYECKTCGCGTTNNHGIPMPPSEEQDEYNSGLEEIS